MEPTVTIPIMVVCLRYLVEARITFVATAGSCTVLVGSRTLHRGILSKTSSGRPSVVREVRKAGHPNPRCQKRQGIPIVVIPSQETQG